jgi:signal transduction histidine kinase
VRPLGSLRNRIFLASVLVATLSIAFAGRFVTDRVAGRAEFEIERGLLEAGDLVQQHYASRVDTLTLIARLVADLPKLKAAADTQDPLTVRGVAADYHAEVGSVGSDLFEVTGANGELLASLGEGGAPDPEAVAAALAGEETTAYRVRPGVVYHVVTVPIVIGAEVEGCLSLGFALDPKLARDFMAVTGSEIAFAFAGAIRASTLPASASGELLAAAESEEEHVIEARIGDEEYAALRRPLGAIAGGPAPVVLILRSRSEQLAFLRSFNTGLVAVALAAALLAVGLSWAVARSVTQPLSAITSAMREMSDTGDLTRRIEIPGRGVDEDAGVLVATFNTLTESIRRFQREAVVRSRLADLGRLSQVIAHEIRNPLMIIKGSLRTLRRGGLGGEEQSEVAEEIDHEVRRLNRIVEDVLDFARPIRVERSPTDVNAVCCKAAEATLDGERATRYALDLDETVGTVMTDGERLRGVLGNLLSNAAEAVASGDGGPGEPRVSLHTKREGGQVSIEVRDRGVGIAAEDLPRIFEPYFTTRRTGTGLGLAISRNVIDSMGGTMTARSRVGEGTTIRIELPGEAS